DPDRQLAGGHRPHHDRMHRAYRAKIEVRLAQRLARTRVETAEDRGAGRHDQLDVVEALDGKIRDRPLTCRVDRDGRPHLVEPSRELPQLDAVVANLVVEREVHGAVERDAGGQGLDLLVRPFTGDGRGWRGGEEE